MYSRNGIRSENAQNLLMCVQQGQTPIYTEYFYFICEYYLHLDGKGFWILNITRVIDIFSPRMTLGKRLKLREE